MIKNQYFKNLQLYADYICSLKSNYLNILSINVRSVSSLDKFNKFKEMLSNLKVLPDVIAVQETWFNNNLKQIYDVPGFSSVHCCRQDGYGGTSLYVNLKLIYTVETCKSEDFVDYIAVKILNYKVDCKSLKIISFYRSQKCNTNNFLRMMDAAMSDNARNPIIVVGDSNMDMFQNSCFEELLTIFQNYDCCSAHSMVTRPTSGTCIDHVFSNYSERIFVDSVECLLSDHNLIFCKIKNDHEYLANSHREIIKTHHDYEKARIFLRNNLPIDYNSLNASDLTDEMLNCVENAIKLSTSTETYCEHVKYLLTPWINKNLQKLIEYKEKLLRIRRKLRKNFKAGNVLKRISKVIKIAKKLCRENYYEDGIKNAGNNMRKSWGFINESFGRKKKSCIHVKDSRGEMILSEKEKADRLNSYFLQSVLDIRQNIEIHPGDWFNSLRTLNHLSCRFLIDNIDIHEVGEVIRSLDMNKSSGCDGISPRFLRECIEELLPVFVCIFNKMVITSVYPGSLKMQKVVPIPKEANVTCVTKYRPIAILSLVDKIFEKILYDRIRKYINDNNILYNCQYGFRKGCSTQEAVLNVLKSICKGLDDGYCGVAGIFLDFTKAFDLVDHNILLKKLYYYGIRGSELDLFKSYFSQRRQYVDINGCKSYVGDVEYGVPQGSGLGPLFFSLYLNDLKNLELSGQLFMFADDVCLFYPYKNDVVLKNQIERDVALIFEFARINRLCLNPGKTQLIRFRPHSASINNNFNVYIDGQSISETHCVKYLGVTLQANLSWDMHMENVKKKIAPAIGILFKLKYKLDVKTKLIIYQSLIQSHFNYMAIVYAYNSNNVAIKSLQRFQNKALKIVYNLPANYSTISLYKNITTILPISGLHKYQSLIYVFKCLHNIGYHTISFLQNQTNFNTRNHDNIRIPLCRLEKTKQRIDYIGAMAYNNLPLEIKSTHQIGRFKTLCRKYIQEEIETLLT